MQHDVASASHLMDSAAKLKIKPFDPEEEQTK